MIFHNYILRNMLSLSNTLLHRSKFQTVISCSKRNKILRFIAKEYIDAHAIGHTIPFSRVNYNFNTDHLILFPYILWFYFFYVYILQPEEFDRSLSVDDKIINEHVTVYVDSGMEYIVMRRPESNAILLITAIDHNKV